jgi:uncharacterized membrane protein (UPF0127 family)
MKYKIVLWLIGSFFFISEVKADKICFENKVCYDVKIAREIDDLQRGLMWVKFLPQNKGMLFDFRKFNKSNISMWMKNTFIALDMVFIDCDNKIQYIYKNATPLSLNEISSNDISCYVLEINAGQVDSKKLAIGDSMKM